MHTRSFFRRFEIAVFAAAAGLGLMSCGGRETPLPDAPRPNIVLITVDTLRADHMSLYGYERETTPEIAAWFSGSTVYERAYSTTSYTPPSIVSVLTGLYPHNHRVRYFYQWPDEDLETLQGVLGKAGYRTAGIVSNVILSSDYMGLDEQFGHYDDYVTERERFRKVFERTGAPTTDAALTWLKSEHDPETPFFLWVHYNDPHGPYTPPVPKVRDFGHAEPLPIDPKRIPDYQRYPDIVDGLEYVDLYDEEIAYLDREVGRLLRGLESTPGFDEMLVFLTADHGESMMDHELWFQHDYHVYEELIHVPLAVRGPGFGPARVDVPVSIVDIAPTIYAALALGPARKLDGVALSQAPALRTVFAESTMIPLQGKWRAAILGTDKWVIHEPRSTEQKVLRRYYDLAQDAHEERPQNWNLEAAPEGARALEEFRKVDPDDFDAPPDFREGTDVDYPKLPPAKLLEAQERLRALGYLD